MASTDIKSLQQLKNEVARHQTAVIHFWAPWCEPCKQLDLILTELAKQYELGLLRVEAEEVPDVSQAYAVSVVPLFIFFKDGKRVDQLEGADVAGLNAMVAQHSKARPAATAPAEQPAKQQQNTGAGTPSSSTQHLEELTSAKSVMLFMKGTPDAPRCGFSSIVVGILRSLGVPFGSFDILTDEAVRQGLKDYSKWPTYPQLYVRGEFLGGCDIVTEMHEDGSLQEELLGATTSDPNGINGNLSHNGHSLNGHSGGQSLQERLQDLVCKQRVMLFMKGMPDAPRCGFSAKVVGILRSLGVPFGSFDILEDDEVREGLKEYSDWPTFPQLYADGELLGGCDVITEMHATGELRGALEEALSDAPA